MSALRPPRELFEKAKFTVDVDSIESAAFSKCSALEVEIDKIEYREGGSLITFKHPGLIKFTDLTLERGTSSNRNFYDWLLSVGNSASAEGGSGDLPAVFKRSLTIEQRRRDHTRAAGWRLYDAFPIKFTAGEWDNDASAVVLEMLTLTYDFFEKA